MKGAIAICLQEIVEKNYGKEKFKEILKASGVPDNLVLLATLDLDDALVLNVITNTIKILNISEEKLFDMFGDYWVNGYAKKLYDAYFVLSSNAKEFLMNMDLVHRLVTEVTKNAHPPHYTYEDKGDRLIMKYNSSRGLPDLLPGLIKGVAKYYNENVRINRLDNNTFEIVFERR